MGIVKAILIGVIFPFLARRKLRFLERDWNWKVVRRGRGAIDYGLKNSVLGISYNRIGPGLLTLRCITYRCRSKATGFRREKVKEASGWQSSSACWPAPILPQN